MSEPARAYMPTKAAIEDWTTPEEVLDPVRKVFGGEIDFDPAGNPMSIVGAKRQVWLPKWVYANAPPPAPLPDNLPEGIALKLRERFIERTINPPAMLLREVPAGCIVGDGLDVEWKGSTFVNPPFSAKELGRFMERSVQAAARGVPVIMLAKAKTGLKAWQAHVRSAAAVCFLAGRVTYGGGNGDPAPFESALILWTQSRTIINRFALEMECLGDTMFHLGGGR